MNFLDFAAQMYPMWILGFVVVITTILSGFGSLVRIEPKAVLKWIGFMAVITITRLFVFKVLGVHPMIDPEAIRQIPWYAGLQVFWEDMTCALPVILLRNLLPKREYAPFIYILAAGFMMASFATGHLYQGWMGAFFSSLYLMVSMARGQRYGFGTIAICHMIYDMATALTFILLFGGN